MAIYDLYGNPVSSGGGSSDFDVTDFAVFTEPDGRSARAATLLYDGKRLFPNSYPQQRKDFIRNYGGGVMIALGDSYTAMGATYFSAFAEKHGLVCDNRGLASSTIAGSEDGLTVGYHPFWVRLNETIAKYQAGHTIDGSTYTCEDVKLVTFMGGANEWSTVNETTDRLGKGPHETDKEKLYGALNYIFNALLSTFVNADIVVILQPMYPAGTVPVTEEAAKNVGFENLAQAQKMSDVQFSCYQMARKEKIVQEMAERYSLIVCDCCFDWHSPINPDDRAAYWVADGHLSAAGNEDMIDKLEKTLNNMLFSRSG